MKSLVIALLCVPLVSCSAAFADVITLSPTPSNLYNLDHSYWYTWGIDTPWDDTQTPVQATLSFDNIRNWKRNDPNVLYIRLLDDAPLGVECGRDNQSGGDAFDGEGVVLTVYRDLSHRPNDLSYSFTPDQVDTLADYAADGRFALSVDPDCHFYNHGVELEIVTGLVPEPATFLLISAGAALPLLRRRR